jgi:hypothetical protein
METAFFAFPYNFDVHYRLAVKRACTDFNVRPIFGDEVRAADHLANKLRASIEQCNLGFYDITGLNPNVMIELGIGLCAQRRNFLMFDAKAHRKSAAVKAFKCEIPSDIAGHEHFKYENENDLDRELRAVLKQALGIGRNSAFDLKIKIDGLVRKTSLRLGEIQQKIPGASRDDIDQAIAALRFEGKIKLEGKAGGARWRARRPGEPVDGDEGGVPQG